MLAGTIQFSTAIQLAKQRLSPRHPSLSVPKCRPLSPGEVLGCTAPVIDDGRQAGGTSTDAIVFVADGRWDLRCGWQTRGWRTITMANPFIPHTSTFRFHLEAIMIANPLIPAFRYDPYARVMTREHYDQQGVGLGARRCKPLLEDIGRRFNYSLKCEWRDVHMWYSSVISSW